jgi:hypothetical protein
MDRMDLLLEMVLFGGDIEKSLDDLPVDPSASGVITDPIGEFVKASETAVLTKGFSNVVADSRWDEPLTAGPALEKRALPKTGTVGQKLGIVKTEVSAPDEDGIRTLSGYNASGELVLYKTLFREVA